MLRPILVHLTMAVMLPDVCIFSSSSSKSNMPLSQQNYTALILQNATNVTTLKPIKVGDVNHSLSYKLHAHQPNLTSAKTTTKTVEIDVQKFFNSSQDSVYYTNRTNTAPEIDEGLKSLVRKRRFLGGLINAAKSIGSFVVKGASKIIKGVSNIISGSKSTSHCTEQPPPKRTTTTTTTTKRPTHKPTTAHSHKVTYHNDDKQTRSHFKRYPVKINRRPNSYNVIPRRRYHSSYPRFNFDNFPRNPSHRSPDLPYAPAFPYFYDLHDVPQYPPRYRPQYQPRFPIRYKSHYYRPKQNHYGNQKRRYLGDARYSFSNEYDYE